MKFMVIVKATPESEANAMPTEKMLTEMTAYNEQLLAAGVMKAGEGLLPSIKAARVYFAKSGGTTVVDGPFTESKELVAGFWIWECGSLGEAVEWARKCPNPDQVDSQLEIRQIATWEDFGDALTDDIKAREASMRDTLGTDA